MSTYNLMKLCVGIDTVQQLVERLRENYQKRKQEKTKPFLYHVTRHRPKYLTEMIESEGSLYWRINGHLQVRQVLIGSDDILVQGQKKCRLWLDSECILVQPRPVHAFQGWRYLKPEEKPDDLNISYFLEDSDQANSVSDDLPDCVRQKLLDLGLW